MSTQKNLTWTDRVVNRIAAHDAEALRIDPESDSGPYWIDHCRNRAARLHNAINERRFGLNAENSKFL